MLDYSSVITGWFESLNCRVVLWRYGLVCLNSFCLSSYIGPDGMCYVLELLRYYIIETPRPE